MPRLQDVFVQGGPELIGRLPTDADVTTTCLICSTAQTLREATYEDGDPESVYTCKNGCQPVLVIEKSPEIGPEWPGRATRLGKFLVRNPASLGVAPPSAQYGIEMPACPQALADNDQQP